MVSRNRSPLAVLISLALIGVVSAPSGAAETFPSRPIQLIVPAPAGGAADINSRLLASFAENELHQKILVVNKPGAGGAIGVQAMLNAQPDGYTIAGVWNSPMTVTPQTFKISYDENSYVTIVLSDVSPLVYCVRKDFPANDGNAFLQNLRSNPNKYTYGTDGVSGMVHLGAERIFRSIGVHEQAIPYDGASQTLESFLGGHVDIYGGSIPPILPFVQNGSAKCLLSTSADHSKMVPQAASVSELAIPQDETLLWHAIVAPAQIPADRLAALEHAFQDAAHSEKYRNFAARQGEVAVAWGSKRSTEVIHKEISAVGAVLRELGLARKDAGY